MGRGVAVGLVARAHQPKVHHPRGAVGVNHDVVGLDVAVREAGLVHRRQPGRYLRENANDLAPRARRRPKPLGQRHPLDVLQRDEEVLAPTTHIVDADDVRMTEARQRPRLADQALAALAVLQQLERDRAAELGIVGRVDDAHCPCAEAIHHFEAADFQARGGGPEEPSLDLELDAGGEQRIGDALHSPGTITSALVQG